MVAWSGGTPTLHLLGTGYRGHMWILKWSKIIFGREGAKWRQKTVKNGFSENDSKLYSMLKCGFLAIFIFQLFAPLLGPICSCTSCSLPTRSVSIFILIRVRAAFHRSCGTHLGFITLLNVYCGPTRFSKQRQAKSTGGMGKFRSLAWCLCV